MKRQLVTLVLAIASFSAFAQWSTDPATNNTLVGGGGSIYLNEMVVNDDGITYFLFGRPTGGGTASYIQIFDEEGYPLFENEGLMFSDYETWTWYSVNDLLFLDNEGNAIACVSDCRNSMVSNLSYTVYKISPTGEMLWGDEGVTLDPNADYRLPAKLDMTTMADGSHIFVWMNGYDYQIMIQRVSGDGELLWDNKVVLADDATPYSYPWVVDAGNNEFIMVYPKGSNQNLVAQKFDFDGEPVWPEETLIYQGGFGSIPIWMFVKVLSDNKGGVFVSWYDDRFFTNYETSYVAYIKNDGSHGFVAGTGGQALSYNADEGLRCFAPSITYDAVNEHLYATWVESSSGQSWNRLMVQKLDMSGQLLWGGEAREIYPLEARAISYLSAQMAEPGQFAVFFMHNYGDSGPYEIEFLATLIDGADGKFIWEDEFTYLTTADGNKSSTAASQLIDGTHWITMWDTNNAVMAQRIFIDGSLLGWEIGRYKINQDQ